MTQEELRTVLTECLTHEILKQNGQVLYSGTDLLERAESKYYFLGFNPAADGTNPSLLELPLNRKKWSAYTSQCWMCKGKCDPTICPRSSKAKHQKNVKRIMSQLRLNPRDTFATSLVFVESDDIRKLKREPFFRAAVEGCWLVHKKMLEAIRPTYIVCLGNGKRDSAYSLVRDKADEKSSERERLRISVLRWTKRMTVRATRSWHRFTPFGGQEIAQGSCGTSLRPGGRKRPQRLPDAVSIAAISSRKNAPRKRSRNCSTSSTGVRLRSNRPLVRIDVK